MKKIPLQQRSIDRLADILCAAEELIEEMPLEDIQPTMIAKRADVTRTSLYHFFPSKYDIFDALASKYHEELQARIVQYFDPSQSTDYRSAWSGVSHVFSDFFNKNPAAATLLLGRKASRQIRYTDSSSSNVFAKDLTNLMCSYTDLQKYPMKEPSARDVFQTILEMLTATFALGMRNEGRISKKTRERAKDATLAYLNSCISSD